MFKEFILPINDKIIAPKILSEISMEMRLNTFFSKFERFPQLILPRNLKIKRQFILDTIRDY